MLGELYALLTALFWTGSAITFSAATVRVGSVYVNIVRLLAAALILPLLLLAAGIPCHLLGTQIGWLAASGIIGFFFGDTFLFKSYEYVSARVSQLVMATTPAITALFAFLFLHSSLTLTVFLGMTVTLAGILLVVLERKTGEPLKLSFSGVGIWYAFLGAVGQAGGMIAARCAFDLGPVNGFLATFIRVLAAVVLIVPMNMLQGTFRHPIKIFTQNTSAFWYTMLGTIFGPVVGVTFSLMAIAHTDVAIAATLIATTPILMLPASRILQREHHSWQAILGAVIAVGGVGILFLR
jgi:drug/metabolite transporter (DMT)-like permease